MIQSRREILKTGLMSVFVGVFAPSVLVNLNPEKTTLQKFVKRLLEEGPSFIDIDHDLGQELRVGKVSMTDLGLLEQYPVYRARLEFVGPDGVWFARNCDTVRIDTFNKDVSGVRAMDIRLGLTKLRMDILEYYIPERRDEGYYVPEEYPQFPATFIDGKTVV